MDKNKGARMGYLQVEHVSKMIKGVEILQDISFSLDKGCICGLQGKNGCGKSMLLRVLCGLVLPSEGEVIIDGKKLDRRHSFPESCGVLIESPGFLNNYTVMDNLESLAEIRGVIGKDEIEAVLKRVGMFDNRNKKFRQCSLGMKQKVGIAAAIMEKPDLILLDEPTNALDQKSTENFWRLIQEEKERGALIIVASHDLADLGNAADKVYCMEEGRITGEK
ncbi:ABC transporter ATP-binding protein [Bilifractor sp. LCP19S3_H10]|jgi:ABC-2 type transport system ATP-binding protein|uniref:ABC transporter ATP-binding protein n=1 Tax=Lachnospiraceae TaxID=186803 RepID=UPI0024314739|nr:ABC transporter ATP-binding protein [Blautia massiliensis (ex Durand et al. 2017)]MCI5759209.1 ABC transporter ATP-binding protein [Eubacterium sp.]MDD6548088.1 ABC transporter ATP-binding protein [Blautia massiliensis (ex Durand et al. 2017)]